MVPWSVLPTSPPPSTDPTAEAVSLYRIDRYLPEFERTYDERYAKRYGPWGPSSARLPAGFSAAATDSPSGVSVPDTTTKCCPLLLPTSDAPRPVAIRSGPCWPPRPSPARSCTVPHRQVLFTIPKRLRIYCRYDRGLLGELARAAWLTVAEVYRQVLDRDDVTPGMVAGIQTFGELIHFHPHFHPIAFDGH